MKKSENNKHRLSNLKRIIAISRKEFLHIIHDPRSLLIIFVMPILQLTMFGYALNMEIQNIDLAIVDISLDGRNGLQLTEQIKSRYPHLPVLILTMHDEALYAKRALRAGASGYVTKHEAAETIIAAIRLMLSGKEYISETMTQRLLKRMHSKGTYG